MDVVPAESKRIVCPPYPAKFETSLDFFLAPARALAHADDVSGIGDAVQESDRIGERVFNRGSGHIPLPSEASDDLGARLLPGTQPGRIPGAGVRIVIRDSNVECEVEVVGKCAPDRKSTRL